MPNVQSAAPSRKSIAPIEPCYNCRTSAPVIELPDIGAYSCMECGEERRGGILMPSGPRAIGYAWSNACLCWRCARAAAPNGVGYYAELPYATGPVSAIYTSDTPFDRYCDECGALIDPNC